MLQNQMIAGWLVADKRFAVDGKLAGDTAWNYGAFALTAATGIILNFFIAARFGIETLGVFNQIYAIYIVSSQFAVYGIHDSAQKYTAEYADNADAQLTIARTAVLSPPVLGLQLPLRYFSPAI
jgi:O-antigen/teichoic acid export membrane protein